MAIDKPRIMVVDDEPDNLDVLLRLLEKEGLDVTAFPDGRRALGAARESSPDLVLLDVRMPEMDGYDVCRRFKQENALEDIPILFLSALDNTEDKIRGFEAGAVDYIAKPLQADEVLARVRTHLELRRYRLHLQDLLQQHSEALVEAHRRLRVWDKAKNDWLKILAHEVRTPLTGVFAVADLAVDELAENSRLRSLIPEYRKSRERMNKLVSDASMLAQLDIESKDFQFVDCSLQTTLRKAIDETQAQMGEGTLALDQASVEHLFVHAEPTLLTRALTDLLATALLCNASEESISIVGGSDRGYVTIDISTDGDLLPDDTLGTFFDVGGQRSLMKPGGDFDLRPALARRIIHLFCGTVTVRNDSGRGIVIDVRLPSGTSPESGGNSDSES